MNCWRTEKTSLNIWKLVFVFNFFCNCSRWNINWVVLIVSERFFGIVNIDVDVSTVLVRRGADVIVVGKVSYTILLFFCRLTRANSPASSVEIVNPFRVVKFYPSFEVLLRLLLLEFMSLPVLNYYYYSSFKLLSSSKFISRARGFKLFSFKIYYSNTELYVEYFCTLWSILFIYDSCVYIYDVCRSTKWEVYNRKEKI